MAKRFGDTWSALNTEQQKIWDEWFDKYVPDCGESDNVGGEIIRAMSQVIYRFFNDGDKAGEAYGIETVSPSHDFLRDSVKGFKLLDGYNPDAKYESDMLDNQIVVFNYLSEHPELFTTPNTVDSRDSTGYEWNDYEDEEDDFYENDNEDDFYDE